VNASEGYLMDVRENKWIKGKWMNIRENGWI